MALEAGAVVAHQAAALAGGEIVCKSSPPECADVGEKEVDGLCDKGVDEETVVLLGFGETHFVHSVPTPEAVAFDPRRDIKQETALLAGCSLGDGVDELLDRDAGKDGLVHEDRGKGVTVLGEQFLKEGGAAAGRGDDEYGLVNLLSAKARVKDVVQEAPDEHDDPEAEEQEKEKGDDHPASELEGACQIVQIKSFGSKA